MSSTPVTPPANPIADVPAALTHRRYAYFGPEGTFTEAALLTVPRRPDAELVPYATVPLALDAVRRGSVDAAMVPMENSIEGGVNATLDDLANGEPLVITREVVIPVSFALLARPGTALGDVKRILTHPHAEAQTRGWVRTNLPDARVYAGSSTAGAAEQVADPSSMDDAAIAAPIAGERYGLQALAQDIGDNPHAQTRFVLVSKPGPPGEPTGADKTSVVLYLRADHSGALMEILEEFAVRGVNLTRIESRPTGHGMGRYCFSVDAEGHVAEHRVGEALMGLRRVCEDLRYLGSYARADGVAPTVGYGVSDEDFHDAQAWLDELRGG